MRAESASKRRFTPEELTEEGHGSSDVEQKVRAFNLLDDYLDRRL